MARKQKTVSTRRLAIYIVASALIITFTFYAYQICYTANVLVDKVTDDIWIVDFGGGNTWGWIDRELHGSKAGDLQALDRITAQLATV